MQVFASHNKNENLRTQSSSGGVFSILATKVIESGGVVYAAGFESQTWLVKHRKVETIGQLSDVLGSKYVWSDLGNSIDDAIRELANNRWVLFCGTPCQIAALRKRAGNHTLLLAVEVVCHGTPSPAIWQQYLQAVCTSHKASVTDITRINFRDKSTGWKNYSFTIGFKNGKTLSELHDDNLYMRAFLADLTLREGCFRCSFKYPDRSLADITLGDLWGITQLAPHIDNDKGTTLVIARTDNGCDAVRDLEVDCVLKFDNVVKYNPAIILPAKKPAKRDAFLSEIKSGKHTLRVLRRYASRPVKEKVLNIAYKFKRYITRVL